MKNRILLILGFAALALRGILQIVLDRTHHSSDLTDFLLGVLLGVGIGLVIGFVLRNGRIRPDSGA